MSTINSTYYQQQGREGHDTYVLPADVAASLRVPKIQYPDNKIPVAVAKQCIPDGLSCARLQDQKGELLLVDVMDLMEASMSASGLACASCRASCEYSVRGRIAA